MVFKAKINLRRYYSIKYIYVNILFPLYMKNRIHNNKYYIKTRFQPKDKTLCVYVETQSNFSYVFSRVKRT